MRTGGATIYSGEDVRGLIATSVEKQRSRPKPWVLYLSMVEKRRQSQQMRLRSDR